MSYGDYVEQLTYQWKPKQMSPHFSNEYGNSLINRRCSIDSSARDRLGINGAINWKDAALHFPPIPSYSLLFPGAQQ